MAPTGTTHTQSFYGETHFFRREERQHLNQVSEEWQTLVGWSFWNGHKWVDAGAGFSDRLLTPYQPAIVADGFGTFEVNIPGFADKYL